MKTNKKITLIILVLLPFLIGYFINRLLSVAITSDNQVYLGIGTSLLSLWSKGGAIVFWFFVGRIFGKLDMILVKSFVLGNIGWGISFILFIWQFILLDDVSINFFISGISQNYVLGFVGLGSRIIRIFTNQIHSNTVVMVSYLLMIIVFGIAFISSSRSKSSNIWR